MADGYIESKQADYLKRKAEWEKKKRISQLKKVISDKKENKQ